MVTHQMASSASLLNDRQLRIVTHSDVDRAGCEQALTAIAEVAASAG